MRREALDNPIVITENHMRHNSTGGVEGGSKEMNIRENEAGEIIMVD
jgi:hypothetical protein